MRKINSRTIQIILGILWIFDGFLQLQPKMFTTAFVTQVVSPATQGQPGFVVGLMHFGITLFLSHPALFNTLFVLTQLSIGTLILFPKTLKIGLSLSIVWGLLIWVFGEGFGGIFSGQLLLMGAPGAALIYVLLAMAVYPKPTKFSPKIAHWLAFVWLILWVGGGIFQLLPLNNSVSAMSRMVSVNSNGAPSWIANTDNKIASFVSGLGNISHNSTKKPAINSVGMGSMVITRSFTRNGSYRPGLIFILGFALIEMTVGISVLFKYRKIAIVFGIVLALCFWIFGQSFGNIYSGVGTDLNSGPLLVLIGLAIASLKDLDKYLSKIGSKIGNWVLGELEPEPEFVINTYSED